MSQVQILVGGGGGGPTIPTSFVTDSGTAIPAANVLNIVGGSNTYTSGAGNTVTVNETGFLTGTGTTVGAVTADIITFAASSSTATAYQISVDVIGFHSGTPATAPYQILGGARTDGAGGGAVTTIGGLDLTAAEEAALVACNATLVASGNNIIVRVTGAAGLTINWKAKLGYISVT